MYCSNCGSQLTDEAKFCAECGAVTKKDAANSKNDNTESKPQTTTKKKIITIAVVAAAVVTGYYIINSYTKVTGSNPLSGEVTLDPSVIETDIHDGVLDQLGEEVTVECPDPMKGKTGEKRNCVITDSLGVNYMVEVTIENAQGFVTWQIQE